jgi:hypothetical protein
MRLEGAYILLACEQRIWQLDGSDPEKQAKSLFFFMCIKLWFFASFFGPVGMRLAKFCKKSLY